MSSDQLMIVSVGEVFGDDEYVIPVYQRAYAWGRDEIATLMRDVRDYRRKRPDSTYYIGSLVTHARSAAGRRTTRYEVVDGQQRLTTVYIILALLTDRGGELHGRLTFEGRDRSTDDLALLADGRGNSGGDTGRLAVDRLQEAGIRDAVETVLAVRDAGEFDDQDLNYLLEHVHVVRTKLPAGTDLNHYFEVMNSRGEQLEKHEIVKANLMAKLSGLEDPDTPTRTLATIWDACSDMNRHIESKFPTGTRTALFGPQWDDFEPGSFAALTDKLNSGVLDSAQGSATLGALLTEPKIDGSPAQTDDTDDTDRYGTIIDFPNFLLHVLALTVKRSDPFEWGVEPDVPLDDKQLVELFELHIRSAEDVQRFGYNLLRVRYLFDRYVIKTDRARESEDDSNWVLHRVRLRRSANSGTRKLSPVSTFSSDDGDTDSSTRSKDHEHIVMLQSMFQVTDSRRGYKNFLYAILEYLHDSSQEIPAPDFIAFLKGLAERRNDTIPTSSLDNGTSTPHFPFNYLDYLLWREFEEGRLTAAEGPYKGVAVQSFRFRYRSSVEHFYPQNPDPSSAIGRLEPEVINRFGNLCLMTRSENSRRSNLAPAAKTKQYRSHQQSLKFQLMAAVTDGSGRWEAAEIEAHADFATKLIGIHSSSTSQTAHEPDDSA